MNASIKSRLEQEYKEAKTLIRNSSLPWEKQMLRLRRLRTEPLRRLRELETAKKEAS